MQQLLILLSRPLRLLNRRVQPLIPPRFALLCTLAHKQGTDAAPLVLAIFHDSRFEDFVLGVLPYSTLDEDPHGGRMGGAECREPSSMSRKDLPPRWALVRSDQSFQQITIAGKGKGKKKAYSVLNNRLHISCYPHSHLSS